MIATVFPFGNSIRMNFAHPPQLKYLHRAFLYSSLIFLQQPFHWLELILSKSKIESTRLKNDPIIILGYWRSGTTFLQRLLCLDPSMAYLTQYEALFPLGSSIHSRFLKPVVSGLVRLFKIRHPSHDVYLEMDFPSEEDIALCAASYPHTPMWSHIYSSSAHPVFDRLLISEMESRESRQFIKMYTYLVKRLTYFKKNKRLILKSPSNTTKIPEILAAFPAARFVYIERDPEEVYFSNFKLLSNNRRQWLQSMTDQEKINFFTASYPKIIQRYRSTKHLIPPENLIEVQFEELRLKPKSLLRKIYSKFGLPPFEETTIDNFLQKNPSSQSLYNRQELPDKVKILFDEFLCRKDWAAT